MNKIARLILAPAVALLALCSCGGGAKGPSPLEAQSERIDASLQTLAQESPMYLAGAKAEYVAPDLKVTIEFADTTVDVNSYTEALVQYVLAQYLKAHTGANLDTVINTLSAEEGSLGLKLADTHGNAREYTVNATRLKQLVKLKPMELSYNDVRTNVADILAARCPAYKSQQNAADCEFEIKGGFAQYTLTFDRASAYNSLNQGSLTGRYLKEIQPVYENFGACRPMVEDLLRSLSIDGYRFIYTDKNGTKTISAGMPWRLING